MGESGRETPHVPWRGFPGPVRGPAGAKRIRTLKREWWKNFPWYGRGGRGKAPVPAHRHRQPGAKHDTRTPYMVERNWIAFFHYCA